MAAINLYVGRKNASDHDHGIARLQVHSVRLVTCVNGDASSSCREYAAPFSTEAGLPFNVNN